MDSVELLSKFANPETIKTLTMMERLVAGLITTILGMGITFVALVVLQFVIGLMAKFSVEPSQEEVAVGREGQPGEVVENTHQENDEEVVAAITATLAFQLKTSVSKIVIRNIEKVGQPSSSWRKAGIAEQMNNIL